uniref:Uncharacterized protein n=1 Tax=Fagus sylvatica TaxID=28930 RepID=A0A2N9EQ39_FAGSY
MTGILLDMDQYTIYAVAMVYWSMSLHLLLGWQWWIGGVGVDAQFQKGITILFSGHLSPLSLVVALCLWALKANWRSFLVEFQFYRCHSVDESNEFKTAERRFFRHISINIRNRPIVVDGYGFFSQTCGPISTGKSISPETSLQVPSKAHTVMQVMQVPSKADPLSISTFDTIQSLALTEICKALIWPLPFGGNSSSEKVNWLVASIEVTMFSKDGSVIYVGRHFAQLLHHIILTAFDCPDEVRSFLFCQSCPCGVLYRLPHLSSSHLQLLRSITPAAPGDSPESGGNLLVVFVLQWLRELNHDAWDPFRLDHRYHGCLRYGLLLGGVLDDHWVGFQGCGPMSILGLTGVIIFFWTSNAYSRVTGIGSGWNCRGSDQEGLEIWRAGLLGVGAVQATHD